MTVTSIKAIETEYHGILFRSRLEARWAIAFDHLGIPWEYEPEAFGNGTTGYLPDFWLPQQQVYIEVKPDDNYDAQKIGLAVQATNKPVVLVIGQPGLSLFMRKGYGLEGECATCPKPNLYDTRLIYSRCECQPQCSGLDEWWRPGMIAPPAMVRDIVCADRKIADDYIAWLQDCSECGKLSFANVNRYPDCGCEQKPYPHKDPHSPRIHQAFEAARRHRFWNPA